MNFLTHMTHVFLNLFLNRRTLKIPFISVSVPPDIDDETTSSDVSVHEGGNTSLVCQARGRPPPRIVWRREDNKGIVVRNPAKEQKGDPPRSW